MTGAGGGPAGIALFGGTFDPPHAGHLIAAQDVLESLGVDALHFIPTGDPPHKPDRRLASGALRLEMLRASIADDPRLETSDVELRRNGPSFTVDTLRELRRRGPDDDLYFVLGVDQFAKMHSWKEPQEVARLARLVVLTRSGDAPEAVDPGVRLSYRLVSVTRIDVSSTQIRQRIRAGRPIRYLVPEPVRRIIEREGLYRDA